MSQVTQAKRGELIDARGFRQYASKAATMLLSDWVGEERAREATGRIATALAASAASSKKPEEFYQCTPESIAKVIAISALTGIMVSSGQAALAYAIPRRPRKSEPPQLQYQLSHRGIAALAKRAGLSIVAIPISMTDTITNDDNGEVVIQSRDIDNPPMTEADLRGVIVLVRSIDTGATIARGYVAKKIINERRASSDAFQFAEKPGNDWAKDSSPWHKWYVEMAMKTAMHYAIGRGWCVIDDTEAVRALHVDQQAEMPLQLTDKSGIAKLEERLGVAVEPEPAGDENLASSEQDA